MGLIQTEPGEKVEEWRSVVGYEGIYEVSDLGRVRRIARHPSAKPGAYLRVKTRRHREQTGRLIKPFLGTGGYLDLPLSWRNIRKTWLVHTLVANAFLGPCPEPGAGVRHLNDDRADNRAVNLVWETQADRRIRYWGPRRPRPKPTPRTEAEPAVRQPSLLSRAGRARWHQIKEAYGHRCVYCEHKPRKLTMDHVIALDAGGANAWSNIAPACLSCNTRKHAGLAPPYQPSFLL